MLEQREIVRHNTSNSCWVVIDNQAYDVTEFLDHHPGGRNSILRYAGRVGLIDSHRYHQHRREKLHRQIVLTLFRMQQQNMNRSIRRAPLRNIFRRVFVSNTELSIRPILTGRIDKHLGPVEPITQTNDTAASATIEYDSGKAVPLSTIQNLAEFETEARKLVSKKAWVYFHSAADSLNAYEVNRYDWTRVNLRPRILRNVARISMNCRILGHDSSIPIFIAPAAQARLGHADGELCLARGAARWNIPYCSSTYSSVAHTDLAKALQEEKKGGALAWQLYVPTEQEGGKQLIAEARRLGFKALVLTVDSAVIGKREEDDRYKAELDHAAGIEIERTTSTTGEAPILRGVHSSTLCWDDLGWIREAWGNSGPLILKGIQTAEDAMLAHEAGVDGIYLSNHGGRQMDFAPSSLHTLVEIRRYYPHLLKEMEVYVDGGVMRGTDVLKALCLGAKAAGLGRPFMYALSAYGTEGVCKAIQRESSCVIHRKYGAN